MSRTTYALLCAALAILPCLPAASAGEGRLPEACEASIREVHATILAQRETITLPEAAILLQTRAGAPCGFDLTGALPTTTDPGAMRALIEELNGGADNPGNDDAPAPPPMGTMLLTELPEEPCLLAGDGPGTIDADLLGIPFPTAIADGEWDGSTGKPEVTGHAATHGGTELGSDGTIFLAGLPIYANGVAGITCTRIVTGTVVEEQCNWWFVVVAGGHRCKQTVTVLTSLVPAGASAHQGSLLDLMHADHKYHVEKQGDA